MKRQTAVNIALATLMFAPAAMGAVIYSTLNGTDGDSRTTTSFEPWLDDVAVGNGGVLSEIRFSLMVDPFAGVTTDQLTDATIYLYADRNPSDGNPVPNDPDLPQFNGIDGLLFKQTLTNLTIPGDGSVATFAASGLANQNIPIFDNSSMWIGLTTSLNFTLAMPLTGPVSAGATNGNIYNYLQFISQYQSQSFTPGPNTAGLPFEISVVPEPASAFLMALGAGTMLLRRRR